MITEEREPKIHPSAVPNARGRLADAVDCIVEGGELGDEIRVVLRMSGGLPEERFQLELVASSEGMLRFALEDRLHDREAADRHQIAPSEFATLLSEMRAADLVAASFPRPPIPPDSLVGRLRMLLNEGDDFEAVFMADPEQARDAHASPPDTLARAVDRFLSFAERRADVALRP